MYVYDKLNCTISFQYIFVAHFSLTHFQFLLIEGYELYSFQLVSHIREEIKRVLEEYRTEKNIFECRCQKQIALMALFAKHMEVFFHIFFV